MYLCICIYVYAYVFMFIFVNIHIFMYDIICKGIFIARHICTRMHAHILKFEYIFYIRRFNLRGIYKDMPNKVDVYE